MKCCIYTITNSAHQHPPTASTRRFAPLKSDEELQRARERAVPKKTKQDTKFCINIWDEWSKHITGTRILPLTEMTNAEMQYRLSQFIGEVRKRDGSVYPPNTLHHIVCGVMRYLRWNGRPDIDFFKDPQFAGFRASLDAEMKLLQSQGEGSKKRQAEVVTEEEENLLWERGYLGDATPQSLLDTMVFYNGLYFALRSCREHRQLQRMPCQIELIEPAGQRAYLRYVEDVLKNHPGGLKGRNITPKVVLHHANTERPECCFVQLFKRYTELCPKDAPHHSFYLRPAQTPSADCWYSRVPLGHNALSKTVARMCKLAGIHGHKTNHSLRATATSRL